MLWVLHCTSEAFLRHYVGRLSIYLRLIPRVTLSNAASGEGLIDIGLDRREQLQLQAQKQRLLEGQKYEAERVQDNCLDPHEQAAPENDEDDDDLEAIE